MTPETQELATSGVVLVGGVLLLGFDPTLGVALVALGTIATGIVMHTNRMRGVGA